MTPRQQQAYYRQHLRFHKAEERAAVGVVLAYFSRLYTNIDHALQKMGPVAVLSMLDGMVTEADHRRLLTTIYYSTGMKAAEKQYTRLRPAKAMAAEMLTKDRGSGPDPIRHHHPETGGWQQRISRMLNQSDTVQRVKDMTARTADLVRSALSTAIGAGLAVTQISGILRNVIISRSRARLIARTEVTRAANMGAEAGAVSTGIGLYKKWVPLLDAKTRYDHLEMYAKPAIRADALFDVGGRKMRYPGDPAGGAAQCVNCRCACIYLPTNPN